MNRTSLSANTGIWLFDEQGDRCCHVEEDESLAYIVYCEDDSYGPILREVVCETCHRKRESTRIKETVVCHDCETKSERRDMLAWKWYDFYPRQGDSSLYICSECVTKPRHEARVRKDTRDHRKEFPHHFND